MIEQTEWTEYKVINSLNTLFKNVEDETRKTITWYHNKKVSKKIGSLILRCVAIIFTSLGGILPLLTAVKQGMSVFDFPLNQLGYIFLATAAAAVGFDKYFGFSSSWMRFMTTSLTLEKELQAFQLEWSELQYKVHGDAPSPETIDKMFFRLREFCILVNEKIEEETRQWISEFQSSLSLLYEASGKKKQGRPFQ